MSLIKILPEYIENFTLTLHPEIRYVSSSVDGSTGSMPLSPRPSSYFKNLVETSQQGNNAYDADNSNISGFNEGDYSALVDLNSLSLTALSASNAGTSADISQGMTSYIELVNSSSQIARNTKRFQILRFDPPFTLSKNTTVKNVIRNVLMPFYAPRYDGCQFSYTNYNTLNFFTSSLVPSNSAIIYPNLTKSLGDPAPYSPTGSFTFDFYINPRYENEKGEEFNAGTIIHLSSSFAVSLVSGTLKDENDLVEGYRILLQLSHSADTKPSSVDLSIANNKRSYPNDLIFLSDDNSLRKNNWHHVSIRWGTNTTNDGSGSINIDDKSYDFNIPSSSILPPAHVSSSALILGNYFNGDGDESRFFNATAGLNEGVFPSIDFGGSSNIDPTSFDFTHPLNAEIHDVKIYNKFLTYDEVIENGKKGRPTTDNLMFYVPPFFVKETPPREAIITPFQKETRATNYPFNTTFSFGVGGFLMNLENHVREFSQGYYPRLFNLTASTIDNTVENISANEYVYATSSIRKRNLTILPNDNGLFSPDFELLRSGTTDMSLFKNVNGSLNLSIVSINEMVTTASAYSGLSTVSQTSLSDALSNNASSLPDDTDMNTLVNQIAGVTPEDMTGSAGDTILTIYQRTRDPSSNEVTLFDISNLYYGNRIQSETFYLTDPDLTGSGGKIKMTLRDNGAGGLYRANAATKHPKWSNVGTVLYNEGLSVVKFPALSYFGQDKFETRFKGEQNTHILTVNIPASIGMFTSSSNPSYMLVSASLNSNEGDGRFVYITGMNLHDDNLNVIMRTGLSQPIKKRPTEDILYRMKIDF